MPGERAVLSRYIIYVDKIKPLKIESGSEVDITPTECDPSEDYISTKGICFEGNESRVLDIDSGYLYGTDVRGRFKLGSGTGTSRYVAICGFDGTASTGRWLEFFANVGSDVSPFAVPESCMIVALTATIATIGTIVFTLYKNGSTVLDTLTISNSKSAVKSSLNLSLGVGDTIGVKVTSGSGSRPVFGTFIYVE